MKFKNFDELKIDDKNSTEYSVYIEKNKKIKKIEIPFYNGDIWDTNQSHQKIKDGSKTKKFKTFLELIKYFDKEIDNNKIFIYDEKTTNLKYCINDIIEYLIIINHYDNIENKIEYLKNVLFDNSIVLSDSDLFNMFKSQGLQGKNNDFQNGFKKAFQNLTTINLENESEIEGFKYGLDKVGKRFEPKAYEELEVIREKYLISYEKNEFEIKNLKNWKTKLKNDLNKTSKKNTIETQKNINDLLNQKQKLMLSGPLKMWYDRLSEYEGGIYLKKMNKDFRFIHIPFKETKKGGDHIIKKYNVDKNIDNIEENIKNNSKKGKIKNSFFWMISVAMIGLILIIFAMSLPIIIFKNELWDDNKKLVIFISLTGSFVLFIYGYILKMLVKNWLSTIHISEEIRERISLTQFYLTLIDEKSMDKNQMNFALIEIFKRINTGLLKEETNNNINEMMNFFKSK